MTNLFERAQGVPRPEQEARVVGGGNSATDQSWQMFQFGADAHECAEYTCSNEQEREPSEQPPSREQDGASSWGEVGEETHSISQARELNLIEVLLLRATSLLASRVASSVGRATDF